MLSEAKHLSVNTGFLARLVTPYPPKQCVTFLCNATLLRTAISFFVEGRFTSDTSARFTQSPDQERLSPVLRTRSASSRWQATGESSCSSLLTRMGSKRAKVPKENCPRWPQDL